MGEKSTTVNGILDAFKKASKRRKPHPEVFHSEVGERMFDEGRDKAARVVRKTTGDAIG